MYHTRLARKALSIAGDSTHPNHRFFSLLPSGRRMRSLRTRTSRLSDGFMFCFMFNAAVVFFSLSGAESFRVVRQAEEEQGTLTKITDKVKSFYQDTVDTASEYLESIRGLKLEEKAKNLYTDTSLILTTYSEIARDQIYHFFYSQQ